MSRIPRPVWLLGWSSLFTDAATEMIYPLLPVYLSRVLGAGPLSLGIIEGVAEAVNSVLKIVSGYVSDRWSTRRPIVIAGYAISSAARPLIALTRSWPQVLLIRALDRTGKGIRGAPRDAMLARLRFSIVLSTIHQTNATSATNTTICVMIPRTLGSLMNDAFAGSI